MSSRRTLRLLALFAVVSLTATLAAVLPAQARPGACGRPSGCTAFELEHSGATFGWYPAASRYEFKTSEGKTPPKAFVKKGKGAYTTRGGMLELRADSNARLSTAWSLRKRTGRWETRFRTDEMRGATKGERYELRIELLPDAKKQHCGGQGITMLTFKPNKQHRARFAIHTLPNKSFRKTYVTPREIGNDQWHTLAVEVKKNRISWYLDAKVIAKETRPAAMLDVPLRMKFSLVPKDGAKMRDTRLNIDWARYWSLKKKGKNQDKVAKAPRTKLGKNPTVC